MPTRSTRLSTTLYFGVFGIIMVLLLQILLHDVDTLYSFINLMYKQVRKQQKLKTQYHSPSIPIENALWDSSLERGTGKLIPLLLDTAK